MKYIPSIAFEKMSGSAKGVTAAKMKGRKYIRNRGYGSGVRTTYQSKVKGIFKMLSTSWKNLSNEQILAWNKLALTQQGRSVLGTSAKISGANLFTRLNYWIVACGGTVSKEPIIPIGVEAPSEAIITLSKDAFTFKLKQQATDVGGLVLVIEASPGQSNGISRAYSKATQITMIEEPETDAIDIKALYEAKNGVVTAAAPRVFFRYFYVNKHTGEKSATMMAEAFLPAEVVGV